MSSTVVCGYDGASWSENRGKDACQMYAEVMGVCSSQFTVGPVTPTSPPYQPATNECACNVVAYNLMAACGWCQSAIQTDWWLTEAEWRGNCTSGSTTYNAATLPATVAAQVLDDLPLWAFSPVIGETWNPALASALAVGGASETGTSTRNVNTRTTALGGFTNTNTRFGGFSTTSTPRYTGYPYSNGFDDGVVRAAVSGTAIALGLIFGLWALIWIGAAVVYYVRQKKRKAWYGPMAKYYAAGGAGGAGGYGGGGLPYAGGPAPYNPSNTPYQPPYGQQPYSVPYENNSQRHLSMAPSNTGAAAGAPLLFNNEPNNMGSPHMTHSSLPPSSYPPSSYGPTSSPSPGPNTNPYGGVDMPHSVTTTVVPPGTNPFNTPYPTPSNEQPYGGPPSALGGPGNTNSMYGAPSGPPPPPHGSAAGYKGHAEVY